MEKLFKALADFQQEVPVIFKDTQAYGYKYADLPTIFEVINPLLKKHGLGFTQLVGENNIKTILFHVESSQQIETITSIPQNVQLKGMNDFQVLGSAITYIRRYALSSMLGLITDKDTDASGEQEKPSTQQSTQQEPQQIIKRELTQGDINKWNGKIYNDKFVFIDNVKIEPSQGQIEKLKTLPNYKP